MGFIDAIMASQASAQFVQTGAHIFAVAFMSPIAMQLSAQARHIAEQASSIDIMAFMPISLDGIGRSIMRIMELHISAQLEHIAMPCMSPMPIEPAHIVQACSAAAQASIHRCITAMSMPTRGPSIFSESIVIIVVVSFIGFSYRVSAEAGTPHPGCRNTS
jgi:hypothetical protein